MAKKNTEPLKLECIRNNSKLELSIKLKCFEFTWNCPSVQQPDYGIVHIEYTPDKLIAETKSLKFYLQQYRYRNAFNEELAERICMDLAYYLKPHHLKVTLEQNSRGGIANTSIVEYNEFDDVATKALAEYKPKANFRGGWPMAK